MFTDGNDRAYRRQHRCVVEMRYLDLLQRLSVLASVRVRLTATTARNSRTTGAWPIAADIRYSFRTDKLLRRLPRRPAHTPEAPVLLPPRQQCPTVNAYLRYVPHSITVLSSERAKKSPFAIVIAVRFLLSFSSTKL